MSFVKIRCKSRALRKLPGMRAKPAALSLSTKLCVMHATHVCTLTPNVWSQRFWKFSCNLQCPALGRSPEYLHRHGQRMCSREEACPDLYLQNIYTEHLGQARRAASNTSLSTPFIYTGDAIHPQKVSQVFLLLISLKQVGHRELLGMIYKAQIWVFGRLLLPQQGEAKAPLLRVQFKSQSSSLSGHKSWKGWLGWWVHAGPSGLGENQRGKKQRWRVFL